MERRMPGTSPGPYELPLSEWWTTASLTVLA